ncbi:MAG: hypothetical protein R3F60_25620 [bacterium]
MLPLLLSLTLLPRLDAGAEVAHDFGLSPLRGTIDLGVDVEVVRAPTWHLDVFFNVRSFVRYNQPPESPVRISPQQVHYPVGLRVRWPLPGDQAWGVFAFHQSNHDIDTTDAVLNRETVAYEVYGAEWIRPHLHVHGGLYWDRGTRLSGKAQDRPFDYLLGGVTVAADHDVFAPGYVAGKLTLIGHRDADHAPAYLDVDGQLDVGARWRGPGGTLRIFLRAQRVENYRWLGDEPRHLILLGTGMGHGG